MTQQYQDEAKALLQRFIDLTVENAGAFNSPHALGAMIQMATVMKNNLEPRPQQQPPPPPSPQQQPPPPPQQQPQSQPQQQSRKRSCPEPELAKNTNCYCGMTISTAMTHDHYKSVHHVKFCESLKLICGCGEPKPKNADGAPKLICRTCGQLLLICPNEDDHDSKPCNTNQTRNKNIQICGKTDFKNPGQQRFHLIKEKT
jgi:hypothetical protein